MPEVEKRATDPVKRTKHSKPGSHSAELAKEIWIKQQLMKMPPLGRERLKTLAESFGLTLPDETDEECKERQRRDHEKFVNRYAPILQAWEEKGEGYRTIVRVWEERGELPNPEEIYFRTWSPGSRVHDQGP